MLSGHPTVLPRPTGLGTSAAALAENSRPARAVGALYCPGAVRDDPALAARVQQGLDAWAAGVGLRPAAVAGLGRLAVLTHPDLDDPVRLGVAAQLLALGLLAQSGTLPGGPAAPPVSSAGGGAGSVSSDVLEGVLEEVFDACDAPEVPCRPAVSGAVTDDPAAVSALSALSALPASPYQVDRVRRAYLELAAAAAPTRHGPHPPWEHLALGHVNAYSPALAALDAVDGYELTPAGAELPQLRRVRQLAALSAALLHDVARPAPSGLTAAIARADGLGTAAAVRRAAAVHDEAMRALQYHAAQLAAVSEVPVRRYLAGLWTWLGGHRTWHAGP